MIEMSAEKSSLYVVCTSEVQEQFERWRHQGRSHDNIKDNPSYTYRSIRWCLLSQIQVLNLIFERGNCSDLEAFLINGFGLK